MVVMMDLTRVGSMENQMVELLVARTAVQMVAKTVGSMEKSLVA
jgi:hypothetical protein